MVGADDSEGLKTLPGGTTPEVQLKAFLHLEGILPVPLRRGTDGHVEGVDQVQDLADASAAVPVDRGSGLLFLKDEVEVDDLKSVREAYQPVEGHGGKGRVLLQMDEGEGLGATEGEKAGDRPGPGKWGLKQSTRSEQWRGKR